MKGETRDVAASQEMPKTVDKHQKLGRGKEEFSYTSKGVWP
jgi:hypothetical protein